MSAAPATPPPPPPARPVLYTFVGLLAVIGTVLVLAGAITALRFNGPPREAMVWGFAAWQVATVGVLSTLAAGLWLHRLVK